MSFLKQEFKTADQVAVEAARSDSGSAGVPTSGVEVDLEERINSVAIGLRDDLVPIVDALGGCTMRPALLVRLIDIDQSLASRLLRATRAGKLFEFLHAIPAPTGLRIFLKAAGKTKVAPDLCQRAAASVNRFQLLIDEFPAGRAGLDAAISNSVPEMRARAERTAKQSAFKGMAYLLGHESNAIVGALARQPSADGRTCDQMHIVGIHGVRRSRPGRPISVFGMRSSEVDSPATLRTLEGEVTHGDLKNMLLRPFCSDPLPQLKGVRDGDYVALTLPDETLAVNVPSTLVIAFILSGAARYRTDIQAEESNMHVLRCPSRICIRSVFIHEEIQVGSAPHITVRLPSIQDQSAGSSDSARNLHELDLSVSVESLGMGLSNIYCKEVPSHAETIAYAFKKVGWDPNRFHVYRYRVIYPPPLVTFTWWFPLADPPQPDSNPQT